MSEENRQAGGIGFLGLLAILFIGLKLAHVIDWHWAWVLSPLWIVPAIIAATMVALFFVYLCTTLIIDPIGRLWERWTRPW